MKLSKHKKKTRAERRRGKRALDKSQRKKRNTTYKAQAQQKVRKVREQMRSGDIPGMKKQNIFMRVFLSIFFFLRDAVWYLRCLIGLHSWKLCSGKPGTPKYYCPRCNKFSEKVWEEMDDKSTNQ